MCQTIAKFSLSRNINKQDLQEESICQVNRDSLFVVSRNFRLILFVVGNFETGKKQKAVLVTDWFIIFWFLFTNTVHCNVNKVA